MWHALIDELWRGMEKEGMGRMRVSSEKEWGAVLTHRSHCTQTSPGSTAWPDLRETMREVRDRHDCKVYTHTHTHTRIISKHLTIQGICFSGDFSCSKADFFLFPLIFLFFPSNHLSLHHRSSASCVTPSTPPALQPCTCSAPRKPYGLPLFASGHGAAAVSQQASLTA